MWDLPMDISEAPLLRTCSLKPPTSLANSCPVGCQIGKKHVWTNLHACGRSRYRYGRL